MGFLVSLNPDLIFWDRGIISSDDGLIKKETKNIKLTKTAKKLTSSNNLVLAGGVALNCVVNGKILNEKIFDKIWIQPTSGDAGGSLGVALSIYHKHLGNKRKINISEDSMFGSYLGNKFENNEVEKFLNTIDANYHFLENDKLIKERKVLGCYLSNHPINVYKNELSEMKLKSLMEINNSILNSANSKFNSIVSGVIIDSRSQKISKNKFITIYKVDDGSQQINVSFYEDKYLKYKSSLQEDHILFFSGEVYIDDYDSQLSMRAEKLYTLTEAREKYSKHLSIVLSSELISKEKIHDIKNIIDKHDSGNTRVVLSYKTRDFIAPINVDKEIYVKITDNLISDIKLITGDDSVNIKYQ